MTDPTPPPKPHWFSIKEAADYLDIGEPTLYRWMREGQITFRKVGDSTRFTQEDLDAVVKIFRSERELEKIRGACPVCKAAQLVEGFLQSTGRIYFKLKEAKFWTLKENSVPTSARLCRNCGAVTLFGELPAVEELIDAQQNKAKSS
ncbi:MAG TPA: helix-turn-helix domain-containing protein [Verrucomicrobiae bacterium]